MRHLRPLMLLVAALFAGTLLVACGGSNDNSKADYAKQVEGVLQPLGQELTSLGSSLSASTDPKQIESGVKQAEDSINSAIGDLEALNPPSDVTKINDDLIAALSDFNSQLEDVRSAAAKSDLSELQKQALQLPDAAQQLQSRLSQIQQDAIDAGVPIEQGTTSGGG